LFYTVDKYGNWEHEANILYQTRSLKDIAKLMKISELELSDKLNHAKQILLKERQKRIAPGLDDKMITAWNALMIKALVDAYKALQERSYLDDAVRLFEFLQTKVLDEIGLKRIFKNDKASINAFADDYAFFIESAIKLYEASGNEQYLIIAKQQMDTSIQKFFSTSVEFFVYRALQDSQLISTKIDLNDDVIPSSNSVFAKSLWILGFVFDNAEYHKIVKRMVEKLQPKIAKHPSAYSNWIQLINWINYGFNQVVISGKNTNECYSNISSIYTPNAMVFQAQPDTMLPLLKEKTSTNELKIYVCKDYTCGLPLYSVEETINTIKP
ncbi:MAG: thioredoxin domain-containing protein, partial [Bacteroidia bacterium]|nr:thioredoxin domain-containing protein [Bacteroidia bacterium]